MVPRRVLLLDDDRDTRELFERQVRHEVEAFTASTLEEARAALLEHDAPLLIADYQLGAVTGLDALHDLKRLRPELMAILISGYQEMASILDAINSGLIFRFLLKPWRRDDLLLVLAQAFDRLDGSAQARLERERLESINRYLLDQGDGAHQIVSRSPAMNSVLERVRRVAPTTSTVLLQGESGTGKELLARVIHEQSNRRDAPFVAVNCGALAQGLLESELFGHERGAFTGADRQRIGKFEFADGGTLFLDEIGDISPRLQVMLLRVLQERSLERVGGSESVDVDVRVITASHRSLEQLVRDGTFRADLFYRLNVFPIALPPLRDRPEDVELLANTFLERCSASIGKQVRRLTPEAERRLTEYAWPGNVRELQNVIERAVILCDGEVVNESVVSGVLGPARGRMATPSEITPAAPDPEANPRAFFEAPPNHGAGGGWQAEVDRRRRFELERALIQSDGNQTVAAKILGLKRTTFIYQARKAGLL